MILVFDASVVPTQVTPLICAKIIEKIKAKEDQFWKEDMLLDPSE